MTATIRPLSEADLPEAKRLIRVAFGTFLGAPDPESFWADLDYPRARFGAENTVAFAAEQDGVLVGSNFATRWGSVGFFGPLTIRPDLWNCGIGQRLVGAVCDVFEEWGVNHAGLFTFAQSANHIWTYGKFSFHPRFLTAIMAAPALVSGRTAPTSRYSELPERQCREAEGAARDLAEQLYPGLDLGGEIRTVAARNLGETIFLLDGDSHLDGFAICHLGAATEAGADTCFVKFGAVRPGAGGDERFGALLDACGDLAAASDMANLVAGVNLAREETYRAMLGRGFKTQIQGVTMHRPNEPGYSRPGLYVLDDWR